MPGRAAVGKKIEKLRKGEIEKFLIKKIGVRVIRPEKKLKKVMVIGWYLREFFLWKRV